MIRNQSSSMMPTHHARRHLAPQEILTKHNASLILTNDGDAPKYVNSEGAAQVSGGAGEKEAEEIIGISINGWDIHSATSTIGNEGEMDSLTSLLEQSLEQKGNDSDDVHNPSGNQRRLCLPEIVFTKAFISFTRRRNNERTNTDDDGVIKQANGLKFNAEGALIEWAECHKYLVDDEPLPSDQRPSSSSYRGVSILKTVDAELWSTRRQGHPQKTTSSMKSSSSSTFGKDAIMAASSNPCSTEFNYDWTFSTPYTGTTTTTISPSSIPKDSHEYENLQKNESSKVLKPWNPSPSSGIERQLLVDQTQPILYFDDVTLYEDDMHDNGYVSLRCKLRVMPTCFFLLVSLFVRVDQVLIRLREVRIFCKFDHALSGDDDDTVDDGKESSKSRKARLWRDVTWKECKWNDLDKHNLPNHVKLWRMEDQDMQQRIQGVLQALPEVDLPKDLYSHSSLDV